MDWTSELGLCLEVHGSSGHTKNVRVVVTWTVFLGKQAGSSVLVTSPEAITLVVTKALANANI